MRHGNEASSIPPARLKRRYYLPPSAWRRRGTPPQRSLPLHAPMDPIIEQVPYRAPNQPQVSQQYIPLQLANDIRSGIPLPMARSEPVATQLLHGEQPIADMRAKCSIRLQVGVVASHSVDDVFSPAMRGRSLQGIGRLLDRNIPGSWCADDMLH